MHGVVETPLQWPMDRRLAHDELRTCDHAALRRLVEQHNEFASCKMFSREKLYGEDGKSLRLVFWWKAGLSHPANGENDWTIVRDDLREES